MARYQGKSRWPGAIFGAVGCLGHTHLQQSHSCWKGNSKSPTQGREPGAKMSSNPDAAQAIMSTAAFSRSQMLTDTY